MRPDHAGRASQADQAERPDHAAPGTVELLPVTGLPRFRPGDDLAGAIAVAAPWLRDQDVVVVTSKVVSKVEGRLVPTPADPEERDEQRRKLVLDEAVRVLARRGRTLITENRLGMVQAASGIDASNVDRDELALLPAEPDASAAALRAALADRLGVDVAVVITDTMGRAWRVGQTDAAIGSAGLAVLHRYAGRHDAYGNELAVTEIAVADQVAAAADLVKGKLGAVPVAVVRGLTCVDDGSTAHDLIRPTQDDLFSLGTAEAIALGMARGQRLAVMDGSNGQAGSALDAGALDVDPLVDVHADAVRLLSQWRPEPGDQESLRQVFLSYLAAQPDACARACVPGHLTASLVLLDAAGEHVLLTLHPRVGRWLQLGGHCEPGDRGMVAAALREGVEESGIDGITIDPEPLHLATHPITCSLGVPTRHLDVRFVGVAPPGAQPAITAESLDLAWWPLDALPAGVDDVPTLVALARQRAVTAR